MIAIDHAPGLQRDFAFQRLAFYDSGVWQTLLGTARSRVRTAAPVSIYGSDRFGEALKLARANLAALKLDDRVVLKQADALEMPAPAAEGVLVTNPPYGVRLHDANALAQLYPKLGDALKKKYAGWTAYIFTADLRLAKLIGLSPSRRIPLHNGALDCRLFEFRIVTGRMRRETRQT
jgi:putative N6-adenine-specific DNA methylase